VFEGIEAMRDIIITVVAPGIAKGDVQINGLPSKKLAWFQTAIADTLWCGYSDITDLEVMESPRSATL